MALQGVHDVHGCHRLPLGVFGVGHCVPDDVLQEHLEDSASLFVDETADSLHATPSGETTDGGLGDALDVVAKDLPVALSSTLAESLAAFAASSHLACLRFAASRNQLMKPSQKEMLLCDTLAPKYWLCDCLIGRFSGTRLVS